MDNYIVKSIGKVVACDNDVSIHLKKEFIDALLGLDGFGYIQVLWWFNNCDNNEMRATLTENNPYRKGPDILGTFATRSPERPNPIALTTAYVTHIDHKNGIIRLGYIDADNGSPILDIKPYTPSLDRVENPIVPNWCAHWPTCNEDSGNFDWVNEFNF